MCDNEKKGRYGGGSVGEIARAQGAYFAARAEPRMDGLCQFRSKFIFGGADDGSATLSAAGH